MAAQRRKRKLADECEKCQYHDACCKSTRTPKGHRLRVNTSGQATELENSLGNDWNVTSSMEISACNLAIPSSESLKYSSLLLDPSPIGMDFPSDTSGSNYQIVLSTNLEHDISQQKTANYSSEAKCETPELPCLVADESDDGICGSNDFQTSGLLNFYRDDILATSSFNSSMEFIDVLNAAYRDCGQINYDMIDMAGKYMILPIHKRSAETSMNFDDNLIEEIIINFDDNSILPIRERTETSMNSDDNSIQEIIMNFDDQPHRHHCFRDVEEIECSDPFSVVALPDLPEALSFTSPILLTNGTKQTKSITLVLDLDETLIHSLMEQCNNADFTIQIILEEKQHTVYVKRRPFLQMFLERVAELFEIVIFTAGQSGYAAKILDILDPKNKIISKRIYRDSCTYSDGCYTKDLRILGLDLAKVAIVDNSPQVFRWQVNNGIPIKSWFNDPSDHSLVHLLPFLESLVDAEDVRPIITKKFCNLPV